MYVTSGVHTHEKTRIRQHTSAYVSIRLTLPRSEQRSVVKSEGSISIRFCTRYTEVPRNLQHTSAYVSANIDRGACVCAPALDVYGGVRVDEVCHVRYVYARLNALSNAAPQVSVLVLLY